MEAATGAAFSVVALIAFLLALGPSDTSGEGVFRYYAKHDTAVEWQTLLFGIAAVLLLWFAGTVWSAARAADPATGGRYGGILLAAAGTSVALYSAGLAAWFTLALSFGGATGSTPDLPTRVDAYTIWNLSDAAFSLSNFPASVFVAAATLALTQTRLMPSWSAWVGGGVALYLVINGCIQALSNSDAANTLGIIAFLLFLAWAFLASVVLTRRAAQGSQPVAMD
jgi:hypothetical protein